jgi:predicted nucleotidyltransferase
MNAVVEALLHVYPDCQAIYIFGSWGTPDERPGSDADIALLLPDETARKNAGLSYSGVRTALEEMLGRPVDLVNLRMVQTVFRKEVIAAGRRIFCADETLVAEFEARTLSYYQKLNDERREILEEFARTGRAYPV